MKLPRATASRSKIAKEAIKTLNAHDYCGVMQWNGNEVWIHGQGPVEIGGATQWLLAAVDRMAPGDMPDFEPAMLLAEQGFLGLQNNAKNNNKPKPAVMHMIVISDGDPGPPKQATLARLKAMGVTISTVAVDAHGTAESQNLANIASQGAPGGKYYSVSNSQIRTRPCRGSSEGSPPRLTVVDLRGRGLSRGHTTVHEMLSGIKVETCHIRATCLPRRRPIPWWKRYYGPPSPAVTTTPPSWPVGTTVWGTSWPLPPIPPCAGRPIGAAIRHATSSSARSSWSMRPAGESGHLRRPSSPRRPRCGSSSPALDDKNQFLNFLTMTGTAVGPYLRSPGPGDRADVGHRRYVGTFPIREAGSYFVTINPGRGMAAVADGRERAYSDEFRDREANEALFERVGSRAAQGRSVGTIDRVRQSTGVQHLSARPAQGRQQPAGVVLAAASGELRLPLDVFVRRVNVNFDWLPPLLARCRDFVLRRRPRWPNRSTSSD